MSLANNEYPQKQKCGVCGEIKPLSEFRKTPHKWNGVVTRCKTCDKINTRKKKLEVKANNEITNKYKTCVLCGKSKLATTDNFCKDRKESDGFMEICIECTDNPKYLNRYWAMKQVTPEQQKVFEDIKLLQYRPKRHYMNIPRYPIKKNALIKYRIKNGLNYSQCADLLGISDSNYRRYEIYWETMPVEFVEKLASHYGIDVKELIVEE
jgi:hypothetical protein